MAFACDDGGTGSPGAVDGAAGAAACDVSLQMDRYTLIEVAGSLAAVYLEVQAVCLASC